ncbi:MAG: lytic transglycosylase domain-containing protein, partial [Stenotrophomonas sp.]|nr:lytic transglycosylase domain-containing protein [Stenotrophomonas sp.]
MKTGLGIAGVLIAALTAMPASAGTLYKCLGADGVSNYVSKRIRGASCSVVGSYRPSARPASRPPAAAPAAAASAGGAATA